MNRLLLLLLTETVHLLSPGVVSVLRLNELLLRLLHLLEASLLRLLIPKSTTVSILESGLLWLDAGRLVVSVVVVSRGLSLHWVAKPIDLSLLLVSLVESGWLWLLGWSIVEEQVPLLLIFELPLSQLFFFPAELDCFREVVVIVLRTMRALRSPRCISLCLVL